MDKHSAKNKGKLERKQIRLFEGDAAILDEYYPRAGHTIIIRIIVHNFVKKLLNKTNQKELMNELESINGSKQE